MATISSHIANGTAQPAGDAATGTEWTQIREALRGLRYGSVSIIVQDGVVVQIDRLEKRRIRRNETPAGGNGGANGTPG